jgi:hypothetical protein
LSVAYGHPPPGDRHPPFPADQLAAAIRCAVEELLTGLLPHVGCGPSPLTPTAVKRNISNHGLKRAQHRTWSQVTNAAS